MANELRRLIKAALTNSMSHSEAADLVGCSPITIRRYRTAAEEKNPIWRDLQDLRDGDLDRTFNKGNGRSVQKRMPDYSQLVIELAKPCVTKDLLWEEYKEADPEGSFSYSQFTHHWRSHERKHCLSMKICHAPGRSVFVDYSGKRFQYYCQKSESFVSVELFVGTLGHSQKIFANATASQTTDDFLIAHRAMFAYFGGVPEAAVSGNLKAAVINASARRFNPQYVAFAEQYDILIDPARPRNQKVAMATLETIRHVPHRDEIVNGHVAWVAAKGRKVLEGLPQIVWTDQTPWREANLWALERASTNKTNIKTVVSAMTGLHAYAKWLEKEDVSWWDFPAREADRCLVRYRGALIDAKDEGELAPSTATQRMATVVRFYRWLWAARLISPVWPMWRERQVGIRITDTFGFERTLMMASTDLAIPNRKRIGDGLEDGLLPVSVASRNSILSFADSHASEELALLLRLGFRTGMRLGTLTDLKVGTLDRAVPDPSFPTWFRIAVGPGAHPAVHTKFGVTGQVWIEAGDLQLLKDYVFSARHLKRQALAKPEHRDNVFLTRFGGRYGTEGAEMSRGLNVEIGRLRKAGVAAGYDVFRTFHFHQSRCTFATELARMAIKHGGVNVAIELVMQALLHQDEATTIKYIRFVEKSAIMAEAADEFSESFLGLLDTNRAPHV